MQVLVPAGRMERWVPQLQWPAAACSTQGARRAPGRRGRRVHVRGAACLRGEYDGLPDPAAFAAASQAGRVGVLLVRKGGFAVAVLEEATRVEYKIGQRHVQGRTKAGGQSQQRFARRRDNQARQAYEAAADHAARILGDVRARW